jgi:hypothetical protein
MPFPPRRSRQLDTPLPTDQRTSALHLGPETWFIGFVEASIIAVIGTLLGTVLVGVGSYVTQTVRYDREAAERLNTIRREAYVEWLGRSHFIYQSVKTAWAAGPTPSPHERWQVLRAISPIESQAALESLRLVAGDSVAATAAALWRHLRQHHVAASGAGSRDEYKAWQGSYWTLRRQFVDAARVEVGLPPLDWSISGVSPWQKKP